MTPEEGLNAAQMAQYTKPPREPDRNIVQDESSGGRLGQIAAALIYSPQAQALGRQGRDDLINTLWGQPTATAYGAPGEPTPGEITHDIHRQEGKEHDIDME